MANKTDLPLLYSALWTFAGFCTVDDAENPGGRRTWTRASRLGRITTCLWCGRAKGVVLKYRRTPIGRENIHVHIMYKHLILLYLHPTTYTHIHYCPMINTCMTDSEQMTVWGLRSVNHRDVDDRSEDRAINCPANWEDSNNQKKMTSWG